MTVLLFLFFTSAVKAQTITVLDLNGLDFGTIVAGDGASVSPYDPGAALFKISVDYEKQGVSNKNGNGPKRFNVGVSFSLPSDLQQQSYNIPLTFSSESGIWNDRNSTKGGTSFDPRQEQTLQMKEDEGNNTDMYIYLGGDIQTSPGQHAGFYSTSIVMTVTELDN